MRILIAEDDATSRIVLATVLTKDGYDVTATDDGGAAWEVLQKPDTPRLAILDLMMPGIDGLELVRRVRAIPSIAPPYLIIVSTKSEKSDVIAALDAGANDYLTKPFDPGELRARIEVGRRMIEMRFELNENVKELKKALAEVRTLKGIVPICANCKNVRDDQGYWNRVESYLNEHTEADFTHAVCPDCMKRLYPQFDDSNVKETKKR
jgi:sigma-B regulation protein RsbU (phosphoserine phosphatase)